MKTREDTKLSIFSLPINILAKVHKIPVSETTIFIRLQVQKNLFEFLKYLIKKIFDKRFSFLFFRSLFVSLLSITATL